MNINSIHGGQTRQAEGLPSPCVPDSCRIVIDRRFLIEEDIDTVKGEITELLEQLKQSRKRFSYELTDLFEVQPTHDRQGPAGGPRCA